MLARRNQLTQPPSTQSQTNAEQQQQQQQQPSFQEFNNEVEHVIAEADNEGTDAMSQPTDFYKPNHITNEDSGAYYTVPKTKPNNGQRQEEDGDFEMGEEEKQSSAHQTKRKTQVDRYLNEDKAGGSLSSEDSFEVDRVRQEYELQLHKQNKIHQEEIKALKLQMQQLAGLLGDEMGFNGQQQPRSMNFQRQQSKPQQQQQQQKQYQTKSSNVDGHIKPSQKNIAAPTSKVKQRVFNYVQEEVKRDGGSGTGDGRNVGNNAEGNRDAAASNDNNANDRDAIDESQLDLPIALRGNNRQKVTIDLKVLKPFANDKATMYRVMTLDGQMYLPPFKACKIDFLRDLCSGAKIVLMNKDIRIIKVPNLAELCALRVQEMAYNNRTVRSFLPEMDDEAIISKALPREYLFNVVNTVLPEFFEVNIPNAFKQRKEQEAIKKQRNFEITTFMYELITNSNQVATNSRGRVLSMLKQTGSRGRRQVQRHQYERGIDIERDIGGGDASFVQLLNNLNDSNVGSSHNKRKRNEMNNQFEQNPFASSKPNDRISAGGNAVGGLIRNSLLGPGGKVATDQQINDYMKYGNATKRNLGPLMNQQANNSHDMIQARAQHAQSTDQPQVLAQQVSTQRSSNAINIDDNNH